MERKPPAVVIIARHGMRLDAVDKDWHLTSPTPYDPPLTYGGWVQGRALGARIASLLKAREESVHAHTPSAGGSSTGLPTPADSVTEDALHAAPRRVRKHKVVIHSSPFLRCVQTSIAISAGMSQFQRVEREHLAEERERLPTPDPSSEEVSPATTPYRSSTPNTFTDTLAKPVDKDRGTGHARRRGAVPKTRLRIDAFLGEWLSPDYYEQITPPPASTMMVASAKGELLRRGEALQRGNDVGPASLAGHFPGGWKNSPLPTLSATNHDEGRFPGMSSLADALPPTTRATSGSEDGYRGRSIKGITIRDVLSRTHSHSLEDFSGGYIPPTPSYAISPADPIPTGYVAHARDACVDIDYQWDSMKEPQNWGDGGEYGEEWSAMHRRFRNGLLSLLNWYTRESPASGGHSHHRHHRHGDEEETDTVLVLVTHGAGCNALIGAMTNQPVLIDVPMASLTMAVRKDVFKPKETNHPGDDEANNDQEEGRQHSSGTDTSLLEEYDMSLIASTDHLDATSNPLAIPQLPKPEISRSRSISTYRHRGDGRPYLIPTSYESSNRTSRGIGLQRASTTNSPQHHLIRGSSGLWGSVSSGTDKEGVEEETDQMPDFSQLDAPQNGAGKGRPQTAVSAEPSVSKQTQEEGKSPMGLWSGASIAQERKFLGKRRWTVGERR